MSTKELVNNLFDKVKELEAKIEALRFKIKCNTGVQAAIYSHLGGGYYMLVTFVDDHMNLLKDASIRIPGYPKQIELKENNETEAIIRADYKWFLLDKRGAGCIHEIPMPAKFAEGSATATVEEVTMNDE